MPRPFIKLDAAILCARYAEGYSVNALAKEIGVDNHVIKRHLLAAGVRLESGGNRLAHYYRMHPEKVQHGRPRIYPLNEGFFDSITDNSAYVIGFIQADGSKSHKDFSITLKQEDAGHLEKIAAVMGAVRPIGEQKNTYNPSKPAAYFAISSQHIVAALSRWGIHRPKTHTASTHPELLFNRHYWRGVVDGDGTLCVSQEPRHIVSLVGSKFICAEFLQFCQSHEAGYTVTVRPHKTIFSVHLNSDDALTVARVLYEGASLYLDRKMKIYQEQFARPELPQQVALFERWKQTGVS